MSAEKSVLLVPLEVDPACLHPLPQAMWDISCHICDKRQARWEYHSEPHAQKKGEPVCAVCWLYDSIWGEGKKSDIDVFIRAVETEASTRFERVDGRLSMCRDADRILGAIVLTSKMFAIQRRKGV